MKTLGLLLIVMLTLNACNRNSKTDAYTGTPFSDERYSEVPQLIPGRLECECFDIGGEGMAYHDTDSINSGSGALNEADGSYLHEFRIDEAVDISYTKFRFPAIDNSPYNMVNPGNDELYVGWTKPGEWIKYTVKVQKTGIYQLGLMYTANKDGKIALSVNDVIVTEPLLIPTTYHAADTISWRQWHHWNYLEEMAEINFEEGLQTITLHTLEVGDMNYNYIDFKLIQ